MHRPDIAALSGYGHRHVAQNGFFDTKTFAANRHEDFPDPFTPAVLDQMRFNVRFTREHAVTGFVKAAHQ